MEPSDPFAGCEALAAMLGAVGVGVSLAGQPMHASTPLVRDVEEQQYLLGVGPMIDAYRTRLPVDTRDLAGGQAAWLPLDLNAVGIDSLLALPLMVDRTCLGAMTLYRHQARQLDSTPRGLADLVAQHTAAAIAMVVTDTPSAHPQHRWLNRVDELQQAIGIVVAQLGVSREQASSRLRAHAYAADTSLADVVSGLRNHTIQLTTDFSADHR